MSTGLISKIKINLASSKVKISFDAAQDDDRAIDTRSKGEKTGERDPERNVTPHCPREGRVDRTVTFQQQEERWHGNKACIPRITVTPRQMIGGTRTESRPQEGIPPSMAVRSQEPASRGGGSATLNLSFYHASMVHRAALHAEKRRGARWRPVKPGCTIVGRLTHRPVHHPSQ